MSTEEENVFSAISIFAAVAGAAIFVTVIIHTFALENLRKEIRTTTERVHALETEIDELNSDRE